MFKVAFYKTEDGRKPAGEFIRSLDEIARKQIVRSIHNLEKEGNLLGMPDSRHLTEDLFELRIRDRSNAYRMIYFYDKDEDKLIIVTSGFVKKTQKTPPEEIERAKSYRDDYRSRH